MNTGVWNRSARSNAVTAKWKHSSGLAGNSRMCLVSPCDGVGARQDVALLGARRHAGRRPGALHVDDHRRDLGVVRQARSARSSARCPGPAVEVKARAPFQRRADHHADRGQLVLGLQDAVVVLAGLGIRAVTSSQNSLKASITEVAGVIGYQAATVAPAYRQPSAVAVLPSIRILSIVGRVHLLQADGQRAVDRLSTSRSRSPARIALWFESISAFLLPNFSSSSSSMTVHVDVQQRHQRARRRRCSSSGCARAARRTPALHSWASGTPRNVHVGPAQQLGVQRPARVVEQVAARRALPSTSRA